MPSYTQASIDSAIQAVQNGMAIKKASRDWGIPKTTLLRRIRDGLTRQEAHDHQQRLPKTQEDELAAWILTQGTFGLAPTHNQIRVLAQKIVAAGGDESPLGKRWMKHFLDRHPELKTLRSQRIEHVRINGASKANIEAFFNRLGCPEVAAIKQDNRWNMDEAGILEGMGMNGLVVGYAHRSSMYVKSPQSRNWISMIECISACGKSINPLIIFRGVHVQDQWIPEDMQDKMAGWRITCSENGWTSNAIALEWLQKIFIPETAPETPAEWRLLVLDGHASHATEDFMLSCFQNNVRLLYLPPHTSHVLQPLDLGVFSSLKSAYRRYLCDYVAITDSVPVGKRNFLTCYTKARQQDLSSRNIRSEWKATGLWPVNKSKPLNSRQMLPEVEAESRETETAHHNTISQITTPKKSSDVYRLMREFNPPQTAEARRSLRATGKGFDKILFGTVQKREKKRAAEQVIANLKPQKRRKVTKDPNDLFLTLPRTRADEEAYIALNQPENVSQAVDQLSFDDMCFSFQIRNSPR